MWRDHQNLQPVVEDDRIEGDGVGRQIPASHLQILGFDRMPWQLPRHLADQDQHLFAFGESVEVAYHLMGQGEQGIEALVVDGSRLLEAMKGHHPFDTLFQRSFSGAEVAFRDARGRTHGVQVFVQFLHLQQIQHGLGFQHPVLAQQ
jgi:hypothetical protein